jgi:hypothetical protein
MQIISPLKSQPMTAALVLKSNSPGDSMQFNFTTREEYLAYRKLWKAAYFQTIQEIRKCALARRDAERAFSNVGPYDNRWKSSSSELGRYRNTAQELGKARRALRELKAHATAQLAERAMSKVEAGRQRALRLAMVR